MAGATETTALLSDDHQGRNLLGSIEDQESRVAGSNGVSTRDDGQSLHKATIDETTWQKELKLLILYSAPLIVTYLLQYSYTMVMIYVAGQIGTPELAASSIANMTANMTGIVLYESMATCLDTLTSQAFGNGKKHLVGLHIQRAIALLMVMTVPIGVIWICSPWILEKILPDQQVAILAGAYLRVFLIGAPGYAAFEAGKRLTQAQGNFTAPMVVAVICAPLNLLWNWLFVFVSLLASDKTLWATADMSLKRLDLGFEGAALAIAVSYTLQPLVLLLYLNFYAPSLLECWPGVSGRRTFQNWGPMVKLAVPSIIMVMSEWFAFEILTFMSSYLSSKHLAAQSVLLSIGVFMYHIPFPISVAGSTRFGNLIGSGALSAARTAFNTQYAVFIGIGLFDIAVLTSLRHVIAELFTEDPEVRHLIASAMPVVAALQFTDATTAGSNALLRGLGRQKIGGWVNLGAYYLFAVPLSLLLTFGPPHLELFGLWAGPILGLGIVTVILFCYMRYTNWEKAVEEARERES